jgi:hypothetical protein
MFGWTYLDRAGEEVGRSSRFDDAEQAEEWMGSSWQELLERGVEAVVLVDEERERVLYRMGLEASEG